ncbi:MAG: hypothetical protein ABIH99_02470 [Candidatus Micrarchaeota archaeon]
MKITASQFQRLNTPVSLASKPSKPPFKERHPFFYKLLSPTRFIKCEAIKRPFFTGFVVCAVLVVSTFSGYWKFRTSHIHSFYYNTTLNAIKKAEYTMSAGELKALKEAKTDVWRVSGMEPPQLISVNIPSMNKTFSILTFKESADESNILATFKQLQEGGIKVSFTSKPLSEAEEREVQAVPAKTIANQLYSAIDEKPNDFDTIFGGLGAILLLTSAVLGFKFLHFMQRLSKRYFP